MYRLYEISIIYKSVKLIQYCLLRKVRAFLICGRWRIERFRTYTFGWYSFFWLLVNRTWLSWRQHLVVTHVLKFFEISHHALFIVSKYVDKVFLKFDNSIFVVDLTSCKPLYTFYILQRCVCLDHRRWLLMKQNKFKWTKDNIETGSCTLTTTKRLLVFWLFSNFS